MFPIKKLNKKYRGKTIYIIGTGVQLATISDDILKKIKNEVTIGCNACFYKIVPTYWMSAHISQAFIATKYLSGKSTMFLLDSGKYKQHHNKLNKHIIVVSRPEFKGNLEGKFGKAPRIRAKNNIIFGAMHLAIILGAKKIVFVGIELTGANHYYHMIPTIMAQLNKDIKSLPKHSDNKFLIRSIKRKHKKFYFSSNQYSIFYRTFKQYRRILDKNNIKLFVTTKNSLLYTKLGVEYKELKCFMT